MLCADLIRTVWLCFVLGGLLTACDSQQVNPEQHKPSVYFTIPDYQISEKHAGGDTTVYLTSRAAYSAPASHLSVSERLDYFSGHSFFHNPWVRAPSTTKARDGLGPLFNTNSCTACHIRNGRGSVQQQSLVLRLSQAAGDHYVGDSLYGEQLQHRAVLGVKPEGQWTLEWREYKMVQTGGGVVSLRAPHLSISHWFLGQADRSTSWSARIAPAMIGLGLLEAIPAKQILDNAQQQHRRNSSIAGRPSWLKRQGESRSLGRFGWKALQSSVRLQSAKAFSQDLGLTSLEYPQLNCTPRQVQCVQNRAGTELEVSHTIMSAVSFYASQGAVPAPRNTQTAAFKRGRGQFYLAGCAQCHRPHWRTASIPGLGVQDIWPYTDLLLHDMGEGLAASAGEGYVGGNEWRTPPLWGVGLAKVVNPNTGYLHDGRARNLLEAVLWHGGEAGASRQAVRLMKVEDREDLLYFLQSL
ncbi:MAG: thiol oxidoreductase [Spongiibacteraceae bacterium]|nr:thiol oxidoreductase [Spongiibacteraceae bacterium]